MGSDSYEEVQTLARGVRELLRQVDRRAMQLRPNPYEPTMAEALAVALLELDRIASEEATGAETMPRFASNYLTRHLSRRLQQRLGDDLRAEFARRLDDLLQALGTDRNMLARERMLVSIHLLLTELEPALLQRRSRARQRER